MGRLDHIVLGIGGEAVLWCEEGLESVAEDGFQSDDPMLCFCVYGSTVAEIGDISADLVLQVLLLQEAVESGFYHVIRGW